MEHDFKTFPELNNAQLRLFYFVSPHRQITNDFTAKVVKVHDGDSITLDWYDRDFVFPLRFVNIAAPELKESGGRESQRWLEKTLLGKEIRVKINKERRVDKWGRLLGNVILQGTDVGEDSIRNGQSKPWERRLEGIIPDFNEVLKNVAI